MSLLSEGAAPSGMKIYSEKDLGPAMESIIKGISFLVVALSFHIVAILHYCIRCR